MLQRTQDHIHANGSKQEKLGIADRFELLHPLTGGGQAETFLARDRGSGHLAVVKRLSLGTVGDWKAVELFQREAHVLAKLAHPSIPAYLEGHVLEEPDGLVSFVLVQGYVEGQTLQQILEGGVLDEGRARSLARDVLEVLVYLHGRCPPVLHRDIKPSNLIRRADGGTSLIDFGAVQAVQRHTQNVGSTIVGTPGFVAPEQMMGRAVPASDLYGLGATLLQLLTGRHPSELPSTGMRIDFSREVNVSAPFAGFLRRLLAPSLEDRFSQAAEALANLSTLPTATESAPGQTSVALKPWSREPLGVRHPTRVVHIVGFGAVLLLSALWVTGILELNQEHGELRIDALLSSGEPIPDTRVYVANELVCVDVPCVLESMKAGRQRVRVEARGYPTREREVVVDRGETTNVFLAY